MTHEEKQLREYKKFLRLSSERELYTIPQAAFRLNVSRNVFNKRFVQTGFIKLKIVDSKLMVPASEIKYAVDHFQSVIHRKAV